MLRPFVAGGGFRFFPPRDFGVDLVELCLMFFSVRIPDGNQAPGLLEKGHTINLAFKPF